VLTGSTDKGVIGVTTTRSNKWRVSSLGVALVACAVVLALLAGSAVAAPAKKQCKVPNLVGKTKKQAKKKLKKAHCALGAVTKEKSATVPRRKVISTNPKAGTTHKAGTKVKLKVSSGKPAGAKKKQCKVPNVVGKTKAQAKKALRNANCKLGKVTKQKSATVAKGKVISSNPVAGTIHKKGAKVNLKISSGAPKVKGQCTVPNVVGQSQAAAEAAITAAGCKVGKVKQKKSTTVPAGDVISTSPKAGKKVNGNRKVNLTVSSGAAASCTVPNVVGQSQSAAEAAIQAAGCTVGKVKQKASSTVAKGNVISTSPKAGKKVKAGAKVNLTVSSGPKSGYPVPKP
jgi:beta-lactam-binding protein with PASTA domain